MTELRAFLVAIAVAVASALGQEQSPTPAVRPAPDPTQLTIDQLIECLPRVGAETRFDKQARKHWTDPMVEEMQRRLLSGSVLTEQQWHRALTHTEIICFRSKWPAGTPYLVCMRDSAWLPRCEIKLKPRTPGLHELTGGVTFWEMCGNAIHGRQVEQMRQTLGDLSIGKHRLVFDAEIARGQDEDIFQTTKVWSGSLSFEVEVVPTLQHAVPAVDSPAMTAAMASSLGVTVRPWGRDRCNQGLLVLDVDTARFPELIDVALSLEIELLHEGKCKHRTWLVAHQYDPVLGGNSVYEANPQVFSFAILQGLPVDAPVDSKWWDGWVLRVTGKDREVLNLWHAERYWAGFVEMPVRELVQQEAARTAGHPPRPFCWMP